MSAKKVNPKHQNPKLSSTEPNQNQTLTTTSVEKLLAVLETATSNIRQLVDKSAPEQPTDTLVEDTIRRLKDTDLFITAKIDVWSKEGMFINLENNVKLPGLLRDSNIGEAPMTFLTTIFNSVIVPLRQEMEDKINKHHARKPLEFNKEDGLGPVSPQLPIVDPSDISGLPTGISLSKPTGDDL